MFYVSILRNENQNFVSNFVFQFIKKRDGTLCIRIFMVLLYRRLIKTVVY